MQPNGRWKDKLSSAPDELPRPLSSQSAYASLTVAADVATPYLPPDTKTLC